MILTTFNFHCYKCGDYHLGCDYCISLLGNHVYVTKTWTTYVLCHLFTCTFAIYRLCCFFFLLLVPYLLTMGITRERENKGESIREVQEGRCPCSPHLSLNIKNIDVIVSRFTSHNESKIMNKIPCAHKLTKDNNGDLSIAYSFYNDR